MARERERERGGGEREFGKSVLGVRHENDDDNLNHIIEFKLFVLRIVS